MAPALPVLDALYATRATLERLASRHGESPAGWKPGVVRQLRARHNALCARVQTHVCSLAGAEYYPAGDRGICLLLGPFSCTKLLLHWTLMALLCTVQYCHACCEPPVHAYVDLWASGCARGSRQSDRGECLPDQDRGAGRCCRAAWRAWRPARSCSSRRRQLPRGRRPRRRRTSCRRTSTATRRKCLRTRRASRR